MTGCCPSQITCVMTTRLPGGVGPGTREEARAGMETDNPVSPDATKKLRRFGCERFLFMIGTLELLLMKNQHSEHQCLASGGRELDPWDCQRPHVRQRQIPPCPDRAGWRGTFPAHHAVSQCQAGYLKLDHQQKKRFS